MLDSTAMANQLDAESLQALMKRYFNCTPRASLLVVCLARGELLDERPDWATSRASA
jgi:hypothetical protein